jgi:hypothetical protein
MFQGDTFDGPKVVLVDLDHPSREWSLPFDATGLVFVEDGDEARALVTTSSADVYLIGTGKGATTRKLKGYLDHGDVGQQVILASGKTGTYYLPNQGKLIDLQAMRVEEFDILDTKLPVLTVYDTCSTANSRGDFVYTDTEYVPGETTHITFESNVLMLGRIDESGKFESHLVYKTEDRIYQCALTEDGIAWLQTETWPGDTPFIRLKRVSVK